MLSPPQRRVGPCRRAPARRRHQSAAAVAVAVAVSMAGCNGLLSIVIPDTGLASGGGTTGGVTSSEGGTSGSDGPPSSDESDSGTSGDCLRWWYPDWDGDGYGDGTMGVETCEPPPGWVDNGDDCDDMDMGINPGVDELCDARDNDCDDATDEWSVLNAACGPCLYEAYESGAQIYYRCDDPLSWEGAQASCRRRGAELTSALSSDENTLLTEFASGDTRWIGLDDRTSEGDFVWADGSAFAFDAWAAGEPDAAPGDGDCVELGSDGLWRDGDCQKASVYLCKLEWTARVRSGDRTPGDG